MVKKPLWVPFKRWWFDVRSYYNVLVRFDSTTFPWKSIKWNKAPLRVFFAWPAALGKILTIDNLRKMHIIVVNWCYMYKKSRQSVDHLLLHCEIASALGNAIFNSVELAWIMPSQVVDFFAFWRGQVGTPHFDAVWKMISSCLMLCL